MRVRAMCLAVLACLFAGAASAQVRAVPAPTSAQNTNDRFSVLIGENWEAFTRHLFEQPVDGKNATFSCDFAYDARTRKTCLRSLNVVEVDDPGDIRFWRVPGQYPNHPDRPGTSRLSNHALVGQIGASGYTAEGTATAYETVIQFFTENNGTGYMCLSAATGQLSYPRNGQGRAAAADDAVCHVMLLHNGTLVIGADTDPAQLPAHSLVIMGNVEIQGCLKIGDVTYGTCQPAAPAAGR